MDRSGVGAAISRIRCISMLHVALSRGRLVKIARNRALAVVSIPLWEIETVKDARWVEDLRVMTLIHTQLPWTEDIFVDIQGNPLPPPAKGWTTTVASLVGSLAHPDHDMGMSSIAAEVRWKGCTIVDRPSRSISRIMAPPVRYGEQTADGWCCRPKMAWDAFYQDELEMVCGYMANRMHPGVPSKQSPARSWWEDPALLTGRFTKNEFVGSLLDLWAGQDKPAGCHPPTCGDLYRATRPNQQPQPAAKVARRFKTES